MLKFLGSGGAFNITGGNNCAYMKLGTELIMLDCGEDVFKKLISYKLFEGISKVSFFITHLHGDHAGRLSTTIAYLYLKVFNQDKSKIQVFFPGRDITEMLKLMGVTEECYTFYLNMQDKKIIGRYNGELEYSFFKTSHVHELTNTFSVSISIENGVNIYYSGDTNNFYFTDRKNEIKNYNYIYQEVTLIPDSKVHLSYNKLLDATKDFTLEDKRRIYLMHLDENFDEDMAVKDGFNIVKNERLS